MKERPILFIGEMVRAILEGRKTQTRRIVKPQPNDVWTRQPVTVVDGKWSSAGCISDLRCPYGQVGDRLWVRETWRIVAWDEDDGTFKIEYCDSARSQWLHIPNDPDGEKFNDLWITICDELDAMRVQPDEDGKYRWIPGECPCRWRPSIQMPHWASRITLEMTGLRVELLQEITEDDARAEGCLPTVEEDGFITCGTRKTEFRKLIESISAPGSWDANPWVWVIEFKKVQP